MDNDFAAACEQAVSRYTDNTPMPFGKHAGKPLANVPDKYLLWYYDEHKFTTDGDRQLVEYIFEAGLIE